MGIRVRKKTCKVCKQKKYLWARGMCKYCAVMSSEKKKPKPRSYIARNSSSVFPKLMKEAVTCFNKVVRLKAADKYGIVKCYTCAWSGSWEDAHCGHYLHSSHSSVRFHHLNANVQCSECNIDLSGNEKVYRERLISDHGLTAIDALDVEAQRDIKVTRLDLQRIIDTNCRLIPVLLSKFEQ